MLAYVAATAAFAAGAGAPFDLGLYWPLWAVLAGVVGAYAIARPLLPARWRLGERLAMAAPVLLVAPAFFSAFTSIKSAIGLVHPYAWDGPLAAADRAMFGTDAWRALQPWLGRPPITAALSALYGLWHPLLILVFGTLTFSLGREALRRQALTALVVSWGLLGTVAAVVFSSVGPCFAATLVPGGPDAFAPQLSYLSEASRAWPILEFAEQHRLLRASAEGRPLLGSGISAMPSMHVAVALLIALVAWRIRRWAGVLGAAYLAVVVVASIHLGWHYATDSLAAVAGAGVIWAACGAVERARGQPAAAAAST